MAENVRIDLLAASQSVSEAVERILLSPEPVALVTAAARGRPVAGEGEESTIVTSYNPNDLLSEEAFDLAAFCENVCMEECKVRIFADEEGPSYEVVE